MKTRYGFVILHYMAYDMTVHCADMLLENYGDKDIRIVIVDNASPNGSGKNLAAYYKEQTAVTVLFSRENVGFARGNNAGYSCLRDSCDYIIIMNNDVLIQQSDFLKKIHDLYLRERYAVLGPDIYSPHGIRKHQNPFFLQTSSKATLQKNLKAMEANNRRFHWFYMKTCMLNAVRRLPFAVYIFQFCKYRVFRHGGGYNEYTHQHVNPVLHGACYIFSKDFINARNYAFYPKTFLYYEENILHYQCMKAELKLLYSPEIQVLHLEDVSTDMVFKKNYQKEKFKLKNMIASLRIFLDVMEE